MPYEQYDMSNFSDGATSYFDGYLFGYESSV